MQNEPNKQKQEADEDNAPKNVEQDGYTAAELGEESAYNDSTETAQQIRRGGETEGDADDRDIVGSTTSADETDNKPVPRHQRGEDDAADKNPETPEN